MKMHGETIEDLERETTTTLLPPPSLNNIAEAPVITSDMPAADTATTISSNSLLDGEGFDAEASHQSFLEALRQWRGEPAPSSSTPAAPSTLPPKPSFTSVKKQAGPNPNGNASSNSTISSETNTFFQQTVAPAVGETAIKFEFKNRTGLCYFDQLRLQRGLLSPSENKSDDATLNWTTTTTANSLKEQGSRDVVVEEEKQDAKEEDEGEGWDSNDEQAFLEIISSKKKHQDEIAVNHSNTSLVMEAPSDHKEKDKNEESASDPEQPWILVMQDITGMEDEAIMESLDAGILVECIPTTRLQVIHPKDDDLAE